MIVQPENNKFDTIMLEVTHRCDMTCNNCYLPNREYPDMDMNKSYELMRKLPERVEFRVVGGEPTIRKDLPEIISNIRKNGHFPSLLSNGLKMSDENYVKTLKDSGLKLGYISANGGTSDDLYEKIDNMKCAGKKLQAIKNVYKYMYLDVGCIVGKGVNEAAPMQLIKFFKENEINNVVLRLKTVGEIGRYMKNTQFTHQEFLDFAVKEFNVPMEHILYWQKNDPTGIPLSFQFPLDVNTKKGSRRRGGIWIKMVHWAKETKNVPFEGVQRLGRITEDYKLAPFFIHVKENEFGY